MPRRRENIECVHCGRFHPQYYGVALKNHARVHQGRRAAAQRQREQPSTGTEEDDMGPIPAVAILTQHLRRLKQEKLTPGNVAQTLLNVWGGDEASMVLLRRLIIPHSPHEEQGVNSLLATARTVIISLTRPLIEAGVMFPTYLLPGLLDDPRWPEQERSQYPIHPSLARTSIGLALLRDDVHAVKMLALLGMNPNSMLLCGYSILAVAILVSARQVLEYLLSIGDEIEVDQQANSYNEQEETAITLAWKVGDVATFRMLLTHNRGRIPGRSIFYICANEHCGAFDEVLQLGLDERELLRARHPISEETPLHAAVLNTDHAVLDSVMQLAARVSDSEGGTYTQYLQLRNTEGQTPLMYAVQHQQIDHAYTLVNDPNSGVNERAWGGQTALWYAARAMDPLLVDMLLIHRCDAGNPVRHRSSPKGTPLNALLYAYEVVVQNYIHRRSENDPRAEGKFFERKSVILDLARILLGWGCQSDVLDDRLRMPVTDHPELFPEWRRLFM
ncbi:ankyrin repeat-containing domain protein [Aspergillus bertholletiae]|uniref:Ankyrin repeat-containing domain protein n=1 Tax=Aspergillus bertholletiae TaxID=1226010 RepID=A0A5N7B8P6_9EURO|nr:ankyrin repeat-containing domain protein [Aspergillus bertholletiae]